jgi:hypothetical protein
MRATACATRGAGGPSGDAAARAREQAQRGGRDDPERALAADEEIAQVVAGVVLAQAVEACPDLAVGGHDLEAEAELARVAEAQHLGAAGVGGEIAADGATALRGEAEREEQAGLLRRRLHGLQHAAGVHRDREIGRIDAAHGVQAAEIDHHLRARGVRHAAADESRVAALRDQADLDAVAPRLRTAADEGGKLRRVGRQGHGEAAAVIALAPVALVGAEIPRGQQVRRAEDRAQIIEQVRHPGLQRACAGPLRSARAPASRRP